jgi:hypothetical protein
VQYPTQLVMKGLPPNKMLSAKPLPVVRFLYRLFYCTKYGIFVWVGKRLFVNRIVGSNPNNTSIL